GTPVATSSVPVSGDATYTSAPATPLLSGSYVWVATYNGDSNNGATAPGSCSDPNETVVVTALTPTVSSLASAGTGVPGESVTASATVSGSGPVPTGTVTFFLCNPTTVS